MLHRVTVYSIAYEVESKTDTYGAVGAAIALLLWAYLLGRLITASAVVNAAAWQRRHEKAQRSGSHRHTPSREGSHHRVEPAP